jgi:hypothetical protein
MPQWAKRADQCGGVAVERSEADNDLVFAAVAIPHARQVFATATHAFALTSGSAANISRRRSQMRRRPQMRSL